MHCSLFDTILFIDIYGNMQFFAVYDAILPGYKWCSLFYTILFIVIYGVTYKKAGADTSVNKWRQRNFMLYFSRSNYLDLTTVVCLYHCCVCCCMLIKPCCSLYKFHHPTNLPIVYFGWHLVQSTRMSQGVQTAPQSSKRVYRANTSFMYACLLQTNFVLYVALSLMH